MDKKHRNRLFFGIIIISLISAFFQPKISLGFPNDVDNDESNSSGIKDWNTDGRMNITLSGVGDYDSGIGTPYLIDGLYQYKAFIPDYEYGATRIELLPQFRAYDDTLQSSKTFYDSDGDSNTYNLDDVVPSTSDAYEYFSDVYLDITSVTKNGAGASLTNKDDVHIGIYDGSSWIYYDLDDTEETWNDFRLLKSINHAQICSMTENEAIRVRVDPTNLYTSMNIVASLTVRMHDDDSSTPYLLKVQDTQILKLSDKWYENLDDLNTNDEIPNFYKIDSPNIAYLDFVLDWISTTTTFSCRLKVDYDGYTLHKDGFSYKTFHSYSGYSGGLTSFSYTLGSDYYRHINIKWTKIELIGTYAYDFRLQDPKTLSYTFLGFNATDYPIWNNYFEDTLSGIMDIWTAGETTWNIQPRWKMDIDIPSYSGYAIINEMEDDEAVELSVTGTDATSGLFKAYLILEVNDTHQRYAVELNQVSGNKFYRINSIGTIVPANYTAFYGIVDKGGNWRTTPNFTLIVNGEFLTMTNIILNNYEYLTTNHYLSFTIISSYCSHYNVSIEGHQKSFGIYTSGTPINVNIDGYGIGLHPLRIWANTSVGFENYQDFVFRVYQSPIFVNKPQDLYEYYDWYGNFILDWDISNNGLDNFTLLLNDDVIVEEDFEDPYLDNVTYFGNTGVLGTGNHNFTLIVRDIDTVEVRDEVIVRIVHYVAPSVTILSPKLSPYLLQKPFAQLLQVNVSNPLIPSYPISSVKWDIVYGSSSYSWKSLTKISSIYQTTFSLLNYEAKNGYTLAINVTDHTSHIYTYTINLRPIISYSFSSDEITYNSDGITIAYVSSDASIISGNVLVIHNPTIKEMDFEVTLDSDFGDADQYLIYRGFDLYYPSNDYNESAYTLWNNIPYSATGDLIEFILQRPIIFNNPPTDDEEGVITMEFRIESIHSFTNVIIKNKLERFISDPTIYSAKVYRLYQGEYVELDEDTYDVELDKFTKFEITWDYISEGQTLYFKIVLTPTTQEQTSQNINMGILIGIVSMASVGVMWMVATAREDSRKWEDTAWGKRKYILYTAIVLGVTFGIGFAVGLFL